MTKPVHAICKQQQAVSQEEPSDRKPDPWSLWMAGHAQLKFVMTECSKTQIRLMGLSVNRERSTSVTKEPPASTYHIFANCIIMEKLMLVCKFFPFFFKNADIFYQGR